MLHLKDLNCHLFCTDVSFNPENGIFSLIKKVTDRQTEKVTTVTLSWQAFTCLYFLAKQRIPRTTKFESLLDLLEVLGVKIQIAIMPFTLVIKLFKRWSLLYLKSLKHTF